MNKNPQAETQAKRSYQKPQAVDLSVSATQGGMSGASENMMASDTPTRKVVGS